MLTPFTAIALLIPMNLFWAGSYAVIKYGLGSLDPLVLVFWRLLFGITLLGIWILIRRKRISLDLNRNDLLRIMFAGLCLALSNILFIIGIERSHATDASLLYVFEPVWGIILASLILREKMLPSTVAGLVTVIVGLAALSGFDVASPLGSSGCSAGIGNVLMVFGLLGESLFTIILKPVAEKKDAAVIFTGVLLVALLVLSVPISMMGNLTFPTTGQAIFAISYLSLICTAVGYTLWVAMMKCIPVNIMLFTVFIQPVTGMLIAAATLDETIDERLLLGGSLLLAGMAIALSGHLRRGRVGTSAREQIAASVAP
jgi:drug/metabolite transporter (DMT)-like permease